MFGILSIRVLRFFSEWWKSDSSFCDGRFFRTILSLADCSGCTVVAASCKMHNQPDAANLAKWQRFHYWRPHFSMVRDRKWEENQPVKTPPLGHGPFSYVAGSGCTHGANQLKPRCQQKRCAPAAPDDGWGACGKRKQMRRHPHASWFGRRSERFRTLLPPALVFLGGYSSSPAWRGGRRRGWSGSGHTLPTNTASTTPPVRLPFIRSRSHFA